jgi:hypothetical protein
MASTTEHIHSGTVGEPQQLEVPAFLGMTEQQSRLLVALYNETDPEFAKQMPTALPIAAQQLSVEFEKRNSVGMKVKIIIIKRQLSYFIIYLHENIYFI